MLISGTTGDDTLTVLSDTSSVQAGTGTDTIVFAGNYAEYTFSQTDSFVSLMTHKTTGQVVSLYGARLLQFDDNIFLLSKTAIGEFKVKSNTDNDQTNPSLASLNNGGFVVTWDTNTDNYSWAKCFDSIGNSSGADLQVNTYTTGSVYGANATTLSNGGFIVTWNSSDQDGPRMSYQGANNWGVFAQRFDASGNSNGAEFQVNTYTTASQAGAKATTLSNGGFVITWTSDAQDGDSSGIFAQRYDGSGNPYGAEFQVNTYTTSDQRLPVTAALSNGGFVITWSSYGQDGDSSGIFAQRYDGSGNPDGAEFQVNAYTTGSQAGSSIAALNNGDFVVTWNSNTSIFAQHYDASGNSKGAEFQVNTPFTSAYNATATALNNGGFVLTWTLSKPNNKSSIFAQRYDGSGNSNGAEFQVNAQTWNSAPFQYSELNSEPTTSALSDGGFVVIWNSNVKGGLSAKRYDAQGNALNAVTIKTLPTLTDTDGNLWDSIIDLGDGNFTTAAEAQTYRSYFGAMGRLPDKGGYDWWLGEIQLGRHTLQSMAAGFIDSSEFKALSDSDNSGVISNEEFILHMYNGVFGRAPDTGGLAWWVGQLDTEAKTQPDAFISMTQSNEYVELTVGTVADMMFY